LQLEHSFTVPVGIDDAWKVLLDIERVAPCMPGAQLETVDGDEFTGTVKVKLGPISLTYKGKAGFVEKDEAAHRTVINAQGRDARGNGTAAAKVTATLTDQSGETKVDVQTDLDITGKPAQFGRGVMADVGNKLIGQFADCLAGKLSGTDEAPAAAAPAKKTTKKASAAGKSTATKSAPAKKAPKKAAPAHEPVAAEPAAEAAGAAAAPPEPAEPEPAQPEPSEATPTEAAPAEAAPSEAAPSEAAPSEATPTEAAPSEAASSGTAEAEPEAAAPADAETARPAPRVVLPTAEVEPIDLLEHAGPAVAKRLAPILAAIIALLIILRQRKR
jgi:carbon monoxide dehydrogenase subunit G